MADRVALLQRLEALSSHALKMYATACLERVLPAYEKRVGETWGVPHNTVALAWSALAGVDVIRHRWHRLRAFNERIMVSIDDYGPDYATQNAVAAGGKLLSEIFGFASSGDTQIDHRERAKRALYISGNALDAVDAFQREIARIEPGQTVQGAVDVERQWQLAALEVLEASQEPALRPDALAGISGRIAGGPVIGSTFSVGWFPWERTKTANGPDLTLFMGAFTRNPKVAYFVYEAKNRLEPHGAQVLGDEVAFIREAVRVEGVARFSYHLRKQELQPWIRFLIYHLVAGEFLKHEFDTCAQIRYRDFDTNVRVLEAYPPHALAEDDR